jgi:hypothetical protein
MAISTLAELESHCSRIHKDSIFSAGIVSVALGLFLPTNKESGEVWFSLVFNITCVSRFVLRVYTALLRRHLFQRRPDTTRRCFC